jgi:hypothetical protein
MSNDDQGVALEIARNVCDGTVDIVSGCREILRYRGVLQGVSSDAWDVITAIESETDDLPLGDARANWDAEALVKIGLEVAAYIERVRPAAQKAFAEIARVLEDQRP